MGKKISPVKLCYYTTSEVANSDFSPLFKYISLVEKSTYENIMPALNLLKLHSTVSHLICSGKGGKHHDYSWAEMGS